MKKLFTFLGIVFLLAVTSCESNKISCPTYANSFPEKTIKEKKVKPGKQKPPKQKFEKPKSGIKVGGTRFKGKVD